jgi:hypothetical protein
LNAAALGTGGRSFRRRPPTRSLRCTAILPAGEGPALRSACHAGRCGRRRSRSARHRG